MRELGGDKDYGGKEDVRWHKEEYADIHLVYEKAGDSGRLVLRVYQEHYQRRSCQLHTILSKIDQQLWEAVYFQ